MKNSISKAFENKYSHFLIEIILKYEYLYTLYKTYNI